MELQRKLLARGVDSDAADDAVERLSEAGWQDDARFAEFLLRSRASAGQGPVRIRAELGMHRLDGDVIAAALSGFDGDWVANARDLARRRFGEGLADDPVRRRKAAELLYRRGFSGDQVRAATSFDPDES